MSYPGYSAAPPPGGYPPQPAYGYAQQPTQMYPSSAHYPAQPAVPAGGYPYAQPAPGAYPYAQPAAAGAYPYQAAAAPSVVVVDYEQGGGEKGPSNYVAAAEKAVRMGFIRKVYGILSVQLLITFGMVAVFTFSAPVKAAVQSSPAALWAAIILSTGFLIALSCCPKVAQTYPTNYLCLLGFTLTEGYLVGVISSTYDSGAVIKAVAVTVVICVALTIFAWQTKIDFTGMGTALFVAVICLMLFGLLCAIFRSSVLDNVYAALGALIFSAYLVFDTQLILGGKHQHKFSIDQYVYAALSLYLDVIQLFLYILRLFGNNRS